MCQIDIVGFKPLVGVFKRRVSAFLSFGLKGCGVAGGVVFFGGFLLDVPFGLCVRPVDGFLVRPGYGLAGESGLLPPAEYWGGMQGACCLRSTLAVCPGDKPRSEFTTRPPSRTRAAQENTRHWLKPKRHWGGGKETRRVGIGGESSQIVRSESACQGQDWETEEAGMVTLLRDDICWWPGI
ncbi:hypothetical protein ACI0FW_03099 [Alcaligenes nematophilus]